MAVGADFAGSFAAGAAGRGAGLVAAAAAVAVGSLTPLAPGPGIVSITWHLGHFPLRPAYSSLTESVCEHAGQVTEMGKRRSWS